MEQLEKEPLFKDIAEIAGKYQAVALAEPKSKKADVYQTYVTMKDSQKDLHTVHVLI
jgi:hypothetical protein